MNSFLNLFHTILNSRSIIMVMALKEIKARYMGSVVGVFWAIIHPMIMIVVYWLVFSIGLKIKFETEVPFVIWFCCAFAPWTAFNEMMLLTTNSITSNASLIKKTRFPSEVFPVIQIVSSSITHAFMMVIVITLVVFYNFSLTFYSLQFLYYWFAMGCLVLGLGWFCSALNVILRDMGQFVTVMIQIWFWVTPLIWHNSVLPKQFYPILKFNPM